MAEARITDTIGKIRRPELVNLINTESTVRDFALLNDEDGVITALDDRTLRIWLRRDTGNYWPSVCFYLDSTPTVIFYHESSRRLFCGCDSGRLIEFLVADDFNKITIQFEYSGHQSSILAIYFSISNELLLSTCREKRFYWYSTNPANDDHQRSHGFFSMPCQGISLAMDESKRHCFIGATNGSIQLLKLKENGKHELLTTLSGHTGTVQNLLWVPNTGSLISGSFDKTIIAWEVSNEQGIAVELNGHSDRIVGISYDQSRRLLVSCSSDGHIVIWPMDVKRKETPKWIKKDSCQICNTPFFWNFREMWERKTIGFRQHHCRKCGRAICDKCSASRTTLPLLGYETSERVCDDCMKILKPEETTPLASSYDTFQGTTRMAYSEFRKLLITACTDRTVKIPLFLSYNPMMIASLKVDKKSANVFPIDQCAERKIWDMSTVV